MTNFPIFIPSKELKYHVTVTKSGRCSLTPEAMTILKVNVGDHMLQTKHEGKHYVAVRPVAMTVGGYKIGKKPEGQKGAFFGSQSLTNLFDEGWYKLGTTVTQEYTNEAGVKSNVIWYELIPVTKTEDGEDEQ